MMNDFFDMLGGAAACFIVYLIVCFVMIILTGIVLSPMLLMWFIAGLLV